MFDSEVRFRSSNTVDQLVIIEFVIDEKCRFDDWMAIFEKFNLIKIKLATQSAGSKVLKVCTKKKSLFENRTFQYDLSCGNRHLSANGTSTQKSANF